MRIKILFLSIAIAVLCSFTPAFAQENFKFEGINLQGDTLYLPNSGSFAIGAGTTIATIYDMAELRGMYVSPLKDGVGDKIGLGVGVSINKLIEKAGGTWLLKGLATSVGLAGLIDMKDKPKIEPALYVTIVKVTF